MEIIISVILGSVFTWVWMRTLGGYCKYSSTANTPDRESANKTQNLRLLQELQKLQSENGALKSFIMQIGYNPEGVINWVTDNTDYVCKMLFLNRIKEQLSQPLPTHSSDENNGFTITPLGQQWIDEYLKLNVVATT